MCTVGPIYFVAPRNTCIACFTFAFRLVAFTAEPQERGSRRRWALSLSLQSKAFLFFPTAVAFFFLRGGGSPDNFQGQRRQTDSFSSDSEGVLA